MAEYNNQSIDIDLEEIFNGLSNEDQEEFLIDMFTNLQDEGARKKVVKDNMWYLDEDTADDIIIDTFWTMNSSQQKDIAERIADIMTPEQREALIDYIKGE